MTAHAPNPAPNAFVRFARKIYNPVGFTKGYNFSLYFIFAGALFGFTLASLRKLNIKTFASEAAPGEWFWFSRSYYKIGLLIHLGCIFPAALLAIVQFTPIVRHKLRMVHRINGYVVILLLLTSNIGALMIARRAFGGSLDTQAGVGVLAISTTVSAIMAYVNIKRLHIDAHRAWMLRTWFYAASIITLRIVMIISALIISKLGGHYEVIRCEQLAFTTSAADASKYPACVADMNGGVAVVKADLSTAQNGMEAGVALEVSFGMALWIALTLHAVGVEIYLGCTTQESERLKKVSLERRLERGMETIEKEEVVQEEK